jgi:predicted amidophosphoribosyltransferase
VIDSSVRGMNIILIDDVITRGQTFNDTGRKLMAAGAASVTGLFLAKTVHPAA